MQHSPHSMVGRPLADLAKELRSRGFTHVVTYGPAVPLDEWDPYGMRGVNHREDDEPYHGEIVEHEGETRVIDAPKGSSFAGSFYLGVWHFITIKPADQKD